jgi:hypothetical protein
MNTRRTRVASALIALSFVAVVTPQAWAWGREGHRLTALVAQQYLTPHTAAAVQELLGTETMAGVASWADEYRQQHPETGPWHFADIPKDQLTYNRDRDCPVSKTDPTSPWRDCVVDRIAYFEMRLADKTLPHEDRYQALKYLIHFIGDINQPFHAMGDARGGNDITVSFLGNPNCGPYTCNLHGIWDTEMIVHEHLAEPNFLALLLSDIKEHNWEHFAAGTPVQWANAGHRYAIDAWAPNGALIDTAYVTAETRIVNAQLALGGLRLARVLNTILSGEPVPPFPEKHDSGEHKLLPKPEATEPKPAAPEATQPPQ